MSLSIYAGANQAGGAENAQGMGISQGSATSQGTQIQKGEGQAGKNRNTIFAGDMGVGQDSVMARRLRAQKEAMKVVMDQHAGESKLDASAKEMENHRTTLADEAKTAHDELKKVEEMRKAYQEDYGVAEGSPEPEDEAYQKAMKEFDDMADEWRGRADSAMAHRMAIGKSLDELKVERAKTHGMVDAQAEADEIMESASKEIIGMIKQDAMDHIDEKLEETVEEAEKKAEEEKEEKERLEEAKEEKEEQEKRLEEAGSSDPVQVSRPTNISDALVNADDAVKEIQKKIKGILEEEALLAEDLKGISVDTVL